MNLQDLELAIIELRERTADARLAVLEAQIDALLAALEDM